MLELQPALTEQDRATIEAHLEEVRARRMVAAVEYHSGRNAKINFESDRIERRLTKEYDLLLKEIARLDKADEALQKRLANIEAIKASQGLLLDSIVAVDTEAAQAED